MKRQNVEEMKVEKANRMDVDFLPQHKSKEALHNISETRLKPGLTISHIFPVLA